MSQVRTGSGDARDLLLDELGDPGGVARPEAVFERSSLARVGRVDRRHEPSENLAKPPGRGGLLD